MVSVSFSAFVMESSLLTASGSMLKQEIENLLTMATFDPSREQGNERDKNSSYWIMSEQCLAIFIIFVLAIHFYIKSKHHNSTKFVSAWA